MAKETKEILLGALVVLAAVIFVGAAFRGGGLSTGGGYLVNATFDDASGLTPGADVRMVGVKVGTVVRQELDPQTYRARVTFTVEDGVKLTTDTSARILPDGLVGTNFISLEPGGEEDLIEPGGAVAYTQGAINIVDLLGRFIAPPESGEAGGAAEEPGDESGDPLGLGGFQ